MKRYVVGVAFNPDKSQVVLIEKKRPAWQADKLNCPGGHIEPTDLSPSAAMTREFCEETGVQVPPGAWRPVLTLVAGNGDAKNDGAVVYFFTTTLTESECVTAQAAQPTDERILIATVFAVVAGFVALGVHKNGVLKIEKPTMPNLPWIVPAARAGVDLGVVLE